MPRARRTPKAPSGKGAVRAGQKAVSKSSAAYKRRNERARALGYRSYYDFRIHDNGRLKPGAPIARGTRSRARGHRGRADFIKSLRRDDLILLGNQVGSIEIYLDKKGVERYRRVDKIVIPASGGPERHYILRNLTREQMADTIDEEERRGVIFSPAPSLDQRRILDY